MAAANKKIVFLGGDGHEGTWEKIQRVAGDEFDCTRVQTADDARDAVDGTVDVFIAKLGTSEVDLAWPLVEEFRAQYPTIFIIIHSRTAVNKHKTRQKLFDCGANMVSNDMDSIKTALERVALQGKEGGSLVCPVCGMTGLSEDELWWHLPQYHVHASDIQNTICPVCNKKGGPFPVHYRNDHGLCAKGIVEPEGHERDTLVSFALVVVRHPDGRFLMVQEFANSGYWLPGGRVDAGEILAEAAIRETEEEAGINIRLNGILRMAIAPKRGYTRMRIIFYGEPIDPDQPPKSIPDYESAGATWVRVEDLDKDTNVRGKEPLVWFPYVANGGHIAPMSLLDAEGAPPPPLPETYPFDDYDD